MTQSQSGPSHALLHLLDRRFSTSLYLVPTFTKTRSLRAVTRMKERAWHSVGVMFFSCKGKLRRGVFQPSLVRHGTGTEVRRRQWRKRAEETRKVDKTPPFHKRFTVSGQVNYRWGTCNSQQGTCSPSPLPRTEAGVGKTLTQNKVHKGRY